MSLSFISTGSLWIIEPTDIKSDFQVKVSNLIQYFYVFFGLYILKNGF